MVKEIKKISLAMVDNNQADKGTKTNPYTWLEYEMLKKTGKWNGGYVDNLYISKDGGFNVQDTSGDDIIYGGSYGKDGNMLSYKWEEQTISVDGYKFKCNLTVSYTLDSYGRLKRNTIVYLHVSIAQKDVEGRDTYLTPFYYSTGGANFNYPCLVEAEDLVSFDFSTAFPLTDGRYSYPIQITFYISGNFGNTIGWNKSVSWSGVAHKM